MIGRYGVDELNKIYLVLTLILIVLSMFTGFQPFYWVSVILLVYTYYRMFSRNVSKMYAQNQKFLTARYRLVAKWNAFRKRWSQRKVYRFYRCPGCKQRVRVPKGKGRICITCPRCRHEFVKKS